MQEIFGDFLFFFFFSSLLKGGASHKKIDLSGNFFLRIYYHSRVMQTVVEHRLTNSLPLSLQLTVRQNSTDALIFKLMLLLLIDKSQTLLF